MSYITMAANGRHQPHKPRYLHMLKTPKLLDFNLGPWTSLTPHTPPHLCIPVTLHPSPLSPCHPSTPFHLFFNPLTHHLLASFPTHEPHCISFPFCTPHTTLSPEYLVNLSLHTLSPHREAQGPKLKSNNFGVFNTWRYLGLWAWCLPFAAISFRSLWKI